MFSRVSVMGEEEELEEISKRFSKVNTEGLLAKEIVKPVETVQTKSHQVVDWPLMLIAPDVFVTVTVPLLALKPETPLLLVQLPAICMG